jgi:SAM-dependent methyltransferase
MKQTDYSQIADSYDNGQDRLNIPLDKNIEILLSRFSHPIHVLDLACGTGNYLQTQSNHFTQEKVLFTGMDLSEAMLEKARAKEINAHFIQGNAETLDFEDGTVEMINNNFAFHHFDQKEKVLLEIMRVLPPGGRLVIRNICPEYMKKYWVYDFFQGTLEADIERFWSAEDTFIRLQELGFKASISIHTTLKPMSYGELLSSAKNRDISQLAIISEESYKSGLEKLHSLDPNDSYLGDISIMELSADKPG